MIFDLFQSRQASAEAAGLQVSRLLVSVGAAFQPRFGRRSAKPV